MIQKYLLGLGAVLFPALLLFSNGRGFGPDWPNHVWMVGYYGEHLRQHGSFPVVVNTVEAGGLAFPLFYGYLFYPLLGAASAYLHPEFVVRCAAVLMFAAQYTCVRKTMRRLKADENLASGFACLTIWSVYALTNLYNRSALTEFFAVGALTCAVCTWFDLLRTSSARAIWRRGLRFGLLLTLAMGFHPITGLYSLPLLVVLLFALPGRVASCGRLLAVAGVTGAAAVVVLAPWVYAVRHFEKDLAIRSLSSEIVDFRASLDRWQTRLNPLPYDGRCNNDDPRNVSTPYLDSQVGLPLLVLAGGLVVRLLRQTEGRARLTAPAFLVVPLLYAMGMLYLSTHVKAFDSLPVVFKKVQFLYRLAAHVNLGFLLVPLFALLWAARARTGAGPRVTVSPVLLGVALTYAGCCVVLKLQHAEVGRSVFAPNQGRAKTVPLVKSESDRDAFVHLPTSSYGHGDYAAPRYLSRLAPGEAERTPFKPFEVAARGGYFGENNGLSVTMEQAGYVRTAVLVFPWSRFEVDGQVLPATDLRSWDDMGLYTAVPVPAGMHTIQYHFEPDREWRFLRLAAQLALLVWVLAIGGLSAARFVRFGRSTAALTMPDRAAVLVSKAA